MPKFSVLDSIRAESLGGDSPMIKLPMTQEVRYMGLPEAALVYWQHFILPFGAEILEEGRVRS